MLKDTLVLSAVEVEKDVKIQKKKKLKGPLP